MRALGIDLGSKRIGVAVSDRSGTIASPLVVIARGKSQRVDHDEIARIAREEEVEAIVVGLPLNMDGSEGQAAVAARREVERMTTVVEVPVFLHDERRSTVQADNSMAQRNMNAIDRRSVVDKVAAAFILQSWLDARSKESEQ
ncbi:MAG: Holliday junction resolvase RuvX [Ilumatobacteraceae bacterium]